MDEIPKIRDLLVVISFDYQRLGVNKKNGSLIRYFYSFLAKSGFRALLLYRIGRFFHLRKIAVVPGLCERLMHHSAHCWIPVHSKIGPGFLIAHVGGIVIGGNTEIGEHCDIRQNVTLGGNFNKTSHDGRTQPKLGDNISIGSGAAIVGPITIGSNSIIGANAVVVSDVPPNVIVAGNPAKVIKEKWKDTERHL